MRLRVIRPQLDRTQQEVLRFIELPLLEKDQAEIGVQDENVWVLDRQPAVDDFSLGERIRFEIDKAEEIENVGIVRTKPLCIFQLAPRLGVPRLLKCFTSAVVVEKENALVERRGDDRVTFGHARADCTLSECRGSACQAAWPRAAASRRRNRRSTSGRRAVPQNWWPARSACRSTP